MTENNSEPSILSPAKVVADEQRRQRVFDAANSLFRQRMKVTADTVAKAAQVSKTTALPHYREWQQLQIQMSEKNLPQDLVVAMHRILADLDSAASKELETYKDVSEKELSETKEYLATSHAKNTQLKSELESELNSVETLEMAIKTSEKQNATITERLIQIEDQLHKAIETNSEAEKQLGDEKKPQRAGSKRAISATK